MTNIMYTYKACQKCSDSAGLGLRLSSSVPSELLLLSASLIAPFTYMWDVP